MFWEVASMSERVRLNARVAKPVVEAYESDLLETYGVIRPYAGTELEKELRAHLDEGDLGTIRTAVEGVADALGVTGREKKSPEESAQSEYPTNVETTPVQYRIAEDVKAKIEAAAAESHLRSTGEYVGHIMHSLVTIDGVAGSVLETLETVREEVTGQEEEQEETTTSTPEAIAERLGEQFTREDYLEAAAAEGVTTERYAVSEHLPAVIEVKGVHPHPNNPELFVPVESDVIEATPDPSRLPYPAMTDRDKRVTVKAEALRALDESWGSRQALDTGDVVDALGGRPNASTARSLMQEITSTSEENGFSYHRRDEVLRVDAEALSADHVNGDALAVADLGDASDRGSSSGESPDETRGSTGEDTAADSAEWVNAVLDRFEDDIDELPDPPIRNAIAKEQYPDEVTVAGVPDGVLEQVSDEEIERVREQARGSDADADEDVAELDAGPVDGQDIDRRFDDLAKATPAAMTDGGVSDADGGDKPSTDREQAEVNGE